MRVTHVITRLIVGGAQENTIATVLGLQGRPGLTVDLLSGAETGPEGSLQPAFERFPGVLTLIPSLVRAIRPWKDLPAFRVLTRHFRAHRPDIVHTHSGKAGLLGRLAAHRAGVPIIIHSIHGPSFGEFQGKAANTLFRAAERVAARRTTHFITVANAMSRQYLAAGIGRPGDFTRIFSGFPLAPFLAAHNDPQLRARLGLRPDDVVIGKIARLFRLKGHDDLIRAAPSIVQACPKARFLLVGGGEWRERFEGQIRALQLERHFVFTGLVPPEQIPALVGIMDILVHLSRREGLARALPQALAAARPVVAYDCDGANEICLENQTGFLVPPGDLATVTRRVIALASDPELRERLGRTGQAFVREHFDVATLVRAQEDLYWRLARSAGITVPPPPR